MKIKAPVIKPVNPIVKFLWKKRQQIIPNKKKRPPRKDKYKDSGCGRFFYA
tara:strand:+ start:212 stop:364 length:153 start_codon:yes stop_codon:yes gene_type:complete